MAFTFDSRMVAMAALLSLELACSTAKHGPGTASQGGASGFNTGGGGTGGTTIVGAGGNSNAGGAAGSGGAGGLASVGGGMGTGGTKNAGGSKETGGTNAGGAAGRSTSSGGSDTRGQGGASVGAGGTAGNGVGSGGSAGIDAGAGGAGGLTGKPGIQPDGTFVTACPNLYQSNRAGPPGVAPLPSPEQSSYQHTEMTAFIHFSLATFDGTEQGDPSDKPTVFAPTNLTQDTVNAWVSDLKGAGFRQAMLTTKHSIGFCLWPSKLTNDCNQYSVAQSNWMNGSGDLVKMWVDAMHAGDMRVAMYLAPWDQHFPSSKTGYQEYMENQLTELLTNYGPVYEIELDGFNAAGSHDTPATVDWSHFYNLARKLQPHILVWAGPEVAQQGAAANPPNFPDLQWIGNESGVASRTTSSRDLSNCAALADGTMAGKNLWCAWECNVSDRVNNAGHWFWHPNEPPMSLANMQSIYFATVGMNGTLIFNVPPDTTGAFDAKDSALLKQFGSWYASLYEKNALKGQPAVADSTWATAGFEGGKALDEDICTYWAAAEGKTSGRLEVTPSSPITFSILSIREPIELGERSSAYHVEIKQNGTWNKAPKDKSGNQIKGTVIGQRQLWQLAQTSAEAIALVIDSARGVPAISELGAY
jgi:alpha-L-fucosidase